MYAVRPSLRDSSPGARIASGRPSFTGLCVLLFLFFGCNEPHVTLPLEDPVSTYSGPWAYRYGDSPPPADARPRWAEPDFDDGGWHPAPQPYIPSGRQGNRYLWLRTRLTGPKLRDPVLFTRSVVDRYEAYLDGVRIAQVGHLSPAFRPRIGGATPMFLRLPVDYVGKTLTLRIYSEYNTIGILPPISIGGRAEILLFIIKRDFTKFFVGFALSIVGAFGIAAFLFFRKERAILYFSLFSLWSGIYIFCARNPARFFIHTSSALWWIIELISLCFMCGFISRVFTIIFGPGPFSLSRRFSDGFFIFLGGGSLLIVCALASASAILPYLQIYILIFALYLSAYLIKLAISRHTDARIVSWGIALATIPIAYDVFCSIGVFHGSLDSPPLAIFVCTIPLGMILVRRIQSMQRRLHDYSAMLQINLAATKQLETSEQAQIALVQVHELLPLSDSRLFLYADGSNELVLVAGRSADGTIVNRAHPEEAALAQAVLRRGKPLWGRHLRSQAQPQEAAKTATQEVRAVAAPLRAQDQLLGALYLAFAAGDSELDADKLELLARLCDQLALSLLTARASRLAMQSSLAQRRLAEQGALLQAAAQLASGDLATPIQVSPHSDLAPLASALDSMRRDLQLKLETLQANNREIHELNDELRRQIEQRSRRVLELALKSEDKRPHRSSHYATDSMLGEHYRVIRLIGQGTMGSVYEVARTTDGRHLAAKVLTARADKTTMVRFAREAQLLSRLNHPNLITIIDVDVTQSGVLYLVMELVRGTTLKHCRDRYRDLGFVLPVLRQIASGLAAIHESGIVHRDLKPANVLVAEQGTEKLPVVKLVDFGISTLATNAPASQLSGKDSRGGPPAQSLSTGEHQALGPPQDPASEPLTASGIAIGTPMYMAPECIDRALGARPPADIFSFGVMAYELITGQWPFARPAIVIAARGGTLSAPTLRWTCQALKPELAELLDRCLFAAAEARPSARELANVIGKHEGV